MKSSKKALSDRGYITNKKLNKYSQLNTQGLLKLITNPSAGKRTIAAKILGMRKEISAIRFLCEALKTEKQLYTKIAISEALGNIGVKSVTYLIELLGIIGNNQHKKLPVKPFNKYNYPLPRDIAARTIIKIGKKALPYLEKTILNGNENQVSESIDSIGYISFYNKEIRSLSILKQTLKKYQKNDLIKWKIIRAFQSFPVELVVKYLLDILKKSNIPAFIWEAERSLKIINKIIRLYKNA